MSELGQTYGAASAVVSAFALGGIAVSLFLQARQAKADQIQAIRGFHTELVRMELDNLPLYLPCWGPLKIPSADGKKQHIYTTLMMDYAWMGYEVGSIPEPLLRDMLGGMFQGDVARRYWTMARAAWVAASHGSRRGRGFLAIVDDEYGKAKAAGPPAITGARDTPPPTPAPGRKRCWRTLTGVLLGTAGGLLLGTLRNHWNLRG